MKLFGIALIKYQLFKLFTILSQDNLLKKLSITLVLLSSFSIAQSEISDNSLLDVAEDKALVPPCEFLSIRNSKSINNIEKCMSLTSIVYTQSQKLFLELTVKKLKEEEKLKAEGTN